MDKTEKPDCYKCKHRRDLPGDCHSACHHPAFAGVMADPLMRIFGIFASVQRTEPIQGKAEGIKVVGNPHGIRRGWFNHPMNFDPVWLQECSGFEARE